MNPNNATIDPPENIRPNMAIFNNVNLPRPLTWQQREHANNRHQMLTAIGRLLLLNTDRNILLNSPRGTGQMVEIISSLPNATVLRVWTLARKLELLMYLNSASLLEYMNLDSLPRRVQALTATVVNKRIRRDMAQDSPCMNTASSQISQSCRPSTDARAQTQVLHSGNLHRTSIINLTSQSAVYEDYNTDAPAAKRGKTQSGSHKSIQKKTPSTTTLASIYINRVSIDDEGKVPVGTVIARVGLSELVFSDIENALSRIIWSFIDGKEIMRCTAVNRSCRNYLPALVTQLHLSCNAAGAALMTRHLSGNTSLSALAAERNLLNLSITSLAYLDTMHQLASNTAHCPQRFIVTHGDHERIVLELCTQLRANGFPNLQKLTLAGLFSNEAAGGECDVLINSLMTGCCPKMEALSLPGNSFGDYGAVKIAQWLHSDACRQLTRLDVRRNFIGEEGIRVLCHAMSNGATPHLEELCLGGNMISDSGFEHLIEALRSGHLRSLKFLGIEMNYVNATSMTDLGTVLGGMVCPLLTGISFCDNSVDNAEARQLIAYAIYNERRRLAERSSNEGSSLNTTSYDTRISSQ